MAAMEDVHPKPAVGEAQPSDSHQMDVTEKRKRESGEEEDEEEEQEELAPERRGGGARDEAEADPNPLWKTSLCSYYRRPGGACSHGAACRYAHGEAELRPRPDRTWDPTSQRAKKLLKTEAKPEPEPEEPLVLDDTSLDKCLIGLPKKWNSDSFKSFLNARGILYKTAKKKKGMTVGFVSFDNIEQVKTTIEVLNDDTKSGKQIKVADAMRRSQEKKPTTEVSLDQSKGNTKATSSGSEDPTLQVSLSLIEGDDAVNEDSPIIEGLVSKTKSARDVVTPLAHMPYSDQLKHKMNALLQTLKRLTRNARKACPDAVPLPEWILKSREIGGLPCKLEGILESPLINGYRNKCEFSVGYSPQGKRTVGFMLGNFREGVTAVEEPVGCPNVSEISCKFALIFQEFVQSSVLPVWNRIDNTGFWRQFTVREGRNQCQSAVAETPENKIADVMLIIQVCSSNVNEEVMKNEFEKMVQTLAQGAVACSPPLSLTTVVVQDHKGISNAAPADCPLIPLQLPGVEGHSRTEKPLITEARIHDYICNLRFCISPTAFFQVNTLAAERLYSLAGDWANLSPDTLLFDICCGTGAIGLTLAHRVGMVVGIEMNDSAVLDAQRNAEINGISNCRFVCGKAEDVMGPLLKEYLDVTQLHDITSQDSESSGIEVDDTNVNDNKDEKVLPLNTSGSEDVVASSPSAEKIPTCSEDNTNHGESLLDHKILNGGCGSLAEGSAEPETIASENSFVSLKKCTSECTGTVEEHFQCRDTKQEGISEEQKVINHAPRQQFKKVVAIVDPPRVGLHPTVIKALRTHPCLRRLVYISCNPESLVANAIELCTPTADKPEKAKGNRGWRNMSSAGLARHRTKSMPKSPPFRPVRAMAVDLFPHTPHCEMVMLLER